MKLQSLAIVFTIIILPLVIILSNYIQMQVDTIALQASYNSKLLGATYDAMSSLEINTANEDLSAVSDSLRTILEASNNTFFNTLATNFGMSNASKSSLEAYVPAILYTLYDGYYIYSPTEQPIIIKYGYTYEVSGDTAIEKTDESYTGTQGGQPIYDANGNLQYLKKDASYTTNISDSNIVYEQKNLLKSYMPYSARYVNGNIDVTINYTLDNYMNIIGTINGVYYTKTGYLIDKNLLVDVLQDGASIKDQILNFNENTAEEYILSNEHNITVKLKENEIESTISMNADGNNITKKKANLKKAYEDYQSLYVSYRNAATSGADTSAVKQNLDNKMNEIRDLEYSIQNAQAVAYYVRSTIFSNWVYSNLNSIRECDIQEGLSEKTEKTFTTNNAKKLGDDYKEIFYKFKDRENVIFDASQDPDGDSNFNNHKDMVIRNSIQYNLNLAFSTYSKMSSGKFTFEMPIMTDAEWDKIVKKVSVVAYLQGMPCGSKNYSNYALVSSTNNELTVIPEDIYYVEKNNFNDENSTCHKIDCTEFDSSDSTTEYIAFPSKEIKYDKIYNKTSKVYEYDHKNVLCYNCIINRNYLKNGSDENSYAEGLDIHSLSANKKTAYYRAVGALRQGLYKTNALTKSEGYYKIYPTSGTVNSNGTPKQMPAGTNTISLEAGNLKRSLGEVKGIKIVLNNINSNDVRETTINFDVKINGTSIGKKSLSVSKYSKNQTIELEVDPNLFSGNNATNISITLTRDLTTSTISFNEPYINIVYK